jgi:hypothetical protein
MVEWVTVRVPAFEKAPSPVVFAPETVTPEMLRLPPLGMMKILKLRLGLPLSPLMVSEEAPGPVMESEPATDVAAIAGSALAREIVLLPFVKSEAAKTISSLAMVALAVRMACRSEPSTTSTTESAVVVTVMVLLAAQRRSAVPANRRARNARRRGVGIM